jgi:site-specific DNA-methyltransferase (adenine-specific)
MNVETVKIDSLTFDPANVRKHDEKNLAAIKASLNRFGQQKPIVVDANGVVRAGNGTLAAAKALGWKEIRIVRSALTGSEATAYAIADNRSAELAEWDDDALAQTLAALQIEDDALAEATGFDLSEIEKLTAPKDVEEDDVPEAPVDPITKPGDLWILGEHRLLCGDSTKAEDVERLMAGAKADLMLTDPPYNVALGMNETPEQAKKRNRRTDGKVVSNDHMPDADFRKFLNDCFSIAFAALKPGGSFYVWHSDSEGLNFRGAVADCGQKTRQCLIWKKSSLIMGRQDYQWQHEPCLYGWRDGASHGWYSDRKQTTILEFDKPSRSEDHPTMKPVGLFAYQMANSTAPQGICYDPFLGSGTTLIAAEQLGRKCYGMEISPAYCDVIVKRWENLTGKKAKRG